MASSSVDVAILGGGLLGWSAAYRLAKAGRRVLVIDALEPGTATNAGAGIIAPGTSVRINEESIDIFSAAVEYYPKLLAELAADGETNTGYATVGSLFIARTDEEADRLPETLELMRTRRAAGMGNIGDAHLVTGAEAKDLFPALSDLPAAIHSTGPARVNGRLMRDSLRAAAEKHGAKLAIGKGSIVTDDDVATGVTVNGETIVAGQTLICGGAWSAALGEQLGVFLDLYPQRGQILHIDMVGQDTSAWPILTGYHSHYILTFPESRVVCGATREHDSGFDPTFTAGGMHEVLTEAFAVADGLRVGKVAEWRVGLRPFARDEKPILGDVPGWRNLFVATGHGPSGLQLGPVSGAGVADLMLGDRPRFDLAPFTAARFG
ncbi:MAG: FAD-binding oxidoreductase [Thermomicrobiales bacterium]|nr:FAD-binding oxidoreductase [Thermomicrobiales bacterium]